MHGAVSPERVARLRTAFDAGVLSPANSPVPRSSDWRHALLDLDSEVQRVCRLPALLDGVRHLIKQPFFLAQVEGR